MQTFYCKTSTFLLKCMIVWDHWSWCGYVIFRHCVFLKKYQNQLFTALYRLWLLLFPSYCHEHFTLMPFRPELISPSIITTLLFKLSPCKMTFYRFASQRTWRLHGRPSVNRSHDPNTSNSRLEKVCCLPHTSAGTKTKTRHSAPPSASPKCRAWLCGGIYPRFKLLNTKLNNAHIWLPRVKGGQGDVQYIPVTMAGQVSLPWMCFLTSAPFHWFLPFDENVSILRFGCSLETVTAENNAPSWVGAVTPEPESIHHSFLPARASVCHRVTGWRISLQPFKWTLMEAVFVHVFIRCFDPNVC